MHDGPIHDIPSIVAADGEAVHLLGPSDLDLAMTPRAALETARRLGDAAIDALIDQAGPTAIVPDPSHA
jgi:hypothetical protein